MANGIGSGEGLSISGSGVTADRLWMDVIASNLANMDTTRTAAGGPYRREEVILTPGGAGASFSQTLAGAMGSPAEGVQVAAVVGDPSPFPLVYDPTSPDANAQGYVRMPNVNEVTEMTDMEAASQSYNANATALGLEEQNAQKALSIGQGA